MHRMALWITILFLFNIPPALAQEKEASELETQFNAFIQKFPDFAGETEFALTPKDNETYSGSASVNLIKKSEANAPAQTIEITGTWNDYDHAKYTAFKTKLNNLKTPEQAPLKANSLIFISDFDATAKAQNLELNLGNQSITLGQASLKANTHDLKEQTSNGNWSLKARAITTSDTSSLKSIIPEQVDLSLEHKNIPISALADTLGSYTTPQFMLHYIALPQKLTAASSSVNINNSIISHPEYTVELDGDLSATEGALWGFTFQLNLEINSSGLDYLIAETDKLAQTQIAFEGINIALKKMKIFGYPTTRESEEWKTFQLKLEKTGTPTLNDMSVFELTKEHPACQTCNGELPSLPSENPDGTACGSCGG